MEKKKVRDKNLDTTGRPISWTKSFLYLSAAIIVLLLAKSFINTFTLDLSYTRAYSVFGKFLFMLEREIFSPFGVITMIAVAYQIGYLLYWVVSRSQNCKGKEQIVGWFRVVFIVSLFPYVFLIIRSLAASYWGYDTGFIISNKIYGFDAAITCFFWTAIGLCFIPIIPICLIIQIVYIIRSLKNKKRK